MPDLGQEPAAAPDAETGAAPLHDFGLLFVHGIGESRRAETLVHFAEPLLRKVRELAQHASGGTAPVDFSILDARLSGDGGAPAHALIRFQVGSPGDPEASTQSWLIAESWWAEAFPTPTFGDIAQWGLVTLPWTLVAHFDDRLRRLGYEAALAVFEPANALVSRRAALLGWLREACWLFVGLLLMLPLLAVIALVLILGAVPIAAVRDLAGYLQRAISAYIGDSYAFTGQAITAAAVRGQVYRDFSWLSARCRKAGVVAHSQGAAVAHQALRRQPLRDGDFFVSLGSGLRKLSEIQRMQDHDRYRAARRAIWGAALAAIGAAAAMAGVARALPLPIWAALLATGVLLIGVISVGGTLILLQQKMLRNVSTPAAEERAAAGTLRSSAPNLLLALLFPAVWAALAWPILHAIHLHLTPLPAARLVLASTGLALGLGLAYTALMEWRRHASRSTNRAAQQQLDRRLYQQRYRFANRNIEWYDYFAAADPVPNGPLLDSYPPPNLRSLMVDNLGSVLRDHTTYWKNLDGFVEPLASLIAGHSKLSAGGVHDEFARLQRRKWRVDWLAACRLWLGVWCFALFAAASEGRNSWLDGVVSAAAAGTDAVREPIDLTQALFGEASFTGYLTQLLLDSPQQLAALAALAVGLLLYAACAAVWNIWNYRESREVARPRDPLGLSAVVACLIAASLLVATALREQFEDRWLLWTWPPLTAAVYAAARLYRSPARSRAIRQYPASLASVLERVDRALQAGRAEDVIELGWLAHQADPGAAENIWWRASDELASAEAAYLVTLFSQNTARRVKAAELLATLALADHEGRFAGRAGDVLLYDANAPDRAREQYERAYQRGNRQVALPLADLLEAADPARSEALLSEAAEAGDVYAAMSLARRREEAARDAQADERRRLLAEAARLYQAALAGGAVHAAVSLCDVLLELRQPAAAREALDTAIRLSLPGACYHLGTLEARLGRPAVAEQCYRTELRRHPEEPDAARAACALGRLVQERGLSEAAKYYYAVALDSAWPSEEAALLLGELLEAEGARSDAIAVYQRAVEQEHAYRAWEYLARAQVELGRYAEAAATLSRRGSPIHAPELYRQIGAGLRDDQTARRFLATAFAQGCVDAISDLRLAGAGDAEIAALIEDSVAGDPSRSTTLAARLDHIGEARWAEHARAQSAAVAAP